MGRKRREGRVRVERVYETPCLIDRVSMVIRTRYGGVEGHTVSKPRETVPTNFAAVIGQTRIMIGVSISIFEFKLLVLMS